MALHKHVVLLSIVVAYKYLLSFVSTRGEVTMATVPVKAIHIHRTAVRQSAVNFCGLPSF